LRPGDHALIYAFSYFTKPLSWQTLLCIQIILFIQISAKIYFLETKLFSKLSIYKIVWTYKVEWSHYFTNFYFVDIYKRISNTFEKTLQREMFISQFVSKTIYQSLTPLFENLLYLTMA
jgi:hypothetical protein